jgi:hypothetical protein
MKLLSRLLSIWMVGLVALTALGCGRVTYVLQQYDGPVRAPELVSVLRIQHDDSAQIVAIDGEALGQQSFASDVRLHIEMLPGKHTLSVKNPAMGESATQQVQVIAEPGRIYRVVLTDRAWHTQRAKVSPPGTWSALIYEVQRDGRLLQEVSLPPGS